MKKFEYKLFELEFPSELRSTPPATYFQINAWFVDRLNELGDEGWYLHRFTACDPKLFSVVSVIGMREKLDG